MTLEEIDNLLDANGPCFEHSWNSKKSSSLMLISYFHELKHVLHKGPKGRMQRCLRESCLRASAVSWNTGRRGLIWIIPGLPVEGDICGPHCRRITTGLWVWGAHSGIFAARWSLGCEKTSGTTGKSWSFWLPAGQGAGFMTALHKLSINHVVSAGAGRCCQCIFLVLRSWKYQARGFVESH